MVGTFEEGDALFTRSAVHATKLCLDAMSAVYPETLQELRDLASDMRRALNKSEARLDAAWFDASRLLINAVDNWLIAHRLVSTPMFLTVGQTVERWAKNPNDKQIYPAVVLRPGGLLLKPPIYSPSGQ